MATASTSTVTEQVLCRKVMVATENLESQYDQVINYLDGYRRFVSDINSRVVQLSLRDPLKYLRIMKEFRAVWRQIVKRVVDYQTFELRVFLVASVAVLYLFLVLLPL